MYTYIYVCIYMYIYICMYMSRYTYIESDRPDTRKREANICKCKRASILMQATRYRSFIHTHTDR